MQCQYTSCSASTA